jgi:hypothetical protein
MTKQKDQLPPALKHGIYSGMALLPGEDPAEFEKFHQEIIAEYNPTGRSEEDIVEDMCRLMWRRQNLATYRLAEWAREKYADICDEFRQKSPQELLAEMVRAASAVTAEELRAEKVFEKSEAELGPALELVEIGDVATMRYLERELEIVDRLDGMIDRCLKRLLFVRGLKSISSHPSAAASPPRIGKAA